MTHFSKSWTPQDMANYTKEYYQKNKPKLIQRSKINYYKNHELNIQKRIQYNQIHKEKKNAINRKSYLKRKLIVLNHYSNNTLACASCGTSDVRVLSIDHIEGKGREHKRKAKFH